DTLMIDIDLELACRKGLADTVNGLAVGKQAEHAQVELAVNRFAPALGIEAFKGRLPVAQRDPVVQIGLTPGQAPQAERGIAPNPCLTLPRPTFSDFRERQDGPKAQGPRTVKLDPALSVHERCVA